MTSVTLAGAFRFGITLLLSALFLLLVGWIVDTLRIDIFRQRQALAAVPIYYRQPMHPSGTVFFRRHGPDSWTGQVIQARISQLHLDTREYETETVKTVHYDQQGFRNPQTLQNWDVAVAGDSFTELGYLPESLLFTSLLSQRIQRPVRNLGVSYTGPLTQLHYLQEYGLSDQLQDAVIVFYEGNDIENLEDEYRALTDWQTNGSRPMRSIDEETAFWTSLRRIIKNTRKLLFPRPAANAYWQDRSGAAVPVTLTYTPLAPEALPEKTVSHLREFLDNYARWGKANGVRVWLAFMPCKERILHGGIAYTPETEQRFRDWQPTGLPAWLNNMAGTAGVKMIDLTKPLETELYRSGQIPFNRTFDTHLNEAGSRAVADELARYLGSPSQDARLPDIQ